MVISALAGGSFIFLGFIFFMFVAVVVGFYTRKGSGIDEHPYGKIYGGAPGAHGPGSASGRDDRVAMSTWSRGTR